MQGSHAIAKIVELWTQYFHVRKIVISWEISSFLGKRRSLSDSQEESNLLSQGLNRFVLLCAEDEAVWLKQGKNKIKE